ncbi:MAG: hypothetical protein V7647_1575 [Acidobacteriota bacterium]|jgi:hypothetical protein
MATKTEKLPVTVEECHELIRRLQEENLQLRQAGALFGQLAERLNHELRLERSLYSDDHVLHGRQATPSATSLVGGR